MINTIMDYIINNIFQIITVIIAVYGAILSTVNYINNKGGLKVDFHYGVLNRGIFGFKKSTSKMILSISNTGNRNEQIHMVGFYINNRQAKFISNFDEIVYGKIAILPKTLQPSERYTIQFKKKNFINFFDKNNLEPKYLLVIDTLGKKYKIKIDYKKIKESI